MKVAGLRRDRRIEAREAFAVFGLLAFIALLAWERTTGAFSFDLPLLHGVHAVSHPFVVESSFWLARVGYSYGVLPIDGLIVIALLILRRHRDAAFAFFSLGGGLLVSALLKMGIQRVRPDLDTVREVQMNYSFPSGHAMATAVLAATAITLTWNTRWRWPVLVATVVFALLVDIGRLHAGVHYPSDVLAGWAAGIAWTCVVHLVVHRTGRGPVSTG